MRLESPDGEADSTEVAQVDETGAREPDGPVLPEGPVLFSATRLEGDRVALRPVAEIGSDTLIPLPRDSEQPGFTDLFTRERMASGTSFTLFAEGFRVGTAHVESVDLQAGRCAPVPVASAVVELIPAAGQVTQFVAVPEGVGAPREFGDFLAREHSYDQRVAALNLATDAISRASATWPGSVLDARADMQALSLDGDRDGALAATFLFQDALRVGPSLTTAAYGIFLLGTGGPTRYDMAYMDYRPVSNGKAAMRFFEQGDWDGDGQTEILLEVFGEEARWMAALDRRGGRWVRVFEESCEPGTPGA
ncbi:MAG TPA: hypothetical protein VLA43_18785 [Longimicrobiales bacterium]|nr:hypothetical protein [Longimicrobiales bacterium]